jgi:hypothetical protein
MFNQNAYEFSKLVERSFIAGLSTDSIKSTFLII